MRISPVLMLLVAGCLWSCQQNSDVKQDKNGITVTIHGNERVKTHKIKLDVVNDRIIHVVAVPADTFPGRPSLMTVPQSAAPSSWKVAETDDDVQLVTEALTVKVVKQTGAVSFTDKNGNVILQEKSGGGKTFEPFQLEGTSTFHVRQEFESPADEAFNGLGQHQQDVINFKGQDVLLVQNNSEVAVPFVVSNKNYGILWDNYSLSKFGDIREFQQLRSLKLEDKEGKSGGLTATYASLQKPTDIFLQQQEDSIAFLALPDMKKFPKGYDLGKGQVTWEGTVSPNESGIHKFKATYAGYVKLWFDGELIFDKWRQCWNPSSHLFSRNLEVGKKYPVKIEWIPDGGESYVGLQWLSPLPQEEQQRLSLFSEVGDKIDYYLIAGNSADDVIQGYRTLTGKAPVMPVWAMGLWQSRERYHRQKQVVDVVREFRKRNIPFDNIVLDWQYWRIDQWGSHAFDSARFPDPDGMIDELHNKLNAHFMISVWPKFYEGVDNYKLFDEKGWLYKLNINNRQKDWIGYISTFYDAYNPEARKLFWNLVNEKLYSKGVDAWWMDATEPDILSNSTVEERKNLMNPTYLGPAARYFNAFPLENARGIYEGQRSEKPDNRVFILTRSAYAGQQRYAAATWSGDIGARWYDLKAQIPPGVNFSLSGIPYWTSDIGGFAVEHRFEHAQGETLEEWREQMTRWFQFGTFCPLFRVHGQYPYREMFNVAPDNHPAYQSMLYYDKLRYKLMPYIYSLAGHVYFNDYTIMRGLVMDFPSDVTALNRADEFMYGPAFLVCPVYEFKAREKEVYLPSGTSWYDLYTGTHYRGGQTMKAEAPYEKMPVFVKAGSIIPTEPALNYTQQHAADPLTLFVYAGADGDFTLYEDEGVNYNYEKGKYSMIPFSYKDATGELTIGARNGEFDTMLKERDMVVVWITANQGIGIDAMIKPAKVIHYTGEQVIVKRDEQ